MEKKKSVRKVRKRLKISDIKRGPGADVGHMLARIKAREVQLTFCCVTICLVVILVSAYFIFSAVRQPKQYNTLQVGSFEVTFKDMKESLGDIVNLTDAIPISDIESTEVDPYVVTIENNSSKVKSFRVDLMDDEAMIESDGCLEQLFTDSYLKYQIDGKNIQEIEEFDESFPLFTATLQPKEKRTYRIRIWVREDAFIDARRNHYHGKLVVKQQKT